MNHKIFRLFTLLLMALVLIACSQSAPPSSGLQAPGTPTEQNSFGTQLGEQVQGNEATAYPVAQAGTSTPTNTAESTAVPTDVPTSTPAATATLAPTETPALTLEQMEALVARIPGALVDSEAMNDGPPAPWKAQNGVTCTDVPYVIAGTAPDSAENVALTHCLGYNVKPMSTYNVTFMLGSYATDVTVDGRSFSVVHGVYDALVFNYAGGDPRSGLAVWGPKFGGTTVDVTYGDETLTGCTSFELVYGVEIAVSHNNPTNTDAKYEIRTFGNGGDFSYEPECLAPDKYSIRTADALTLTGKAFDAARVAVVGLTRAVANMDQPPAPWKPEGSTSDGQWCRWDVPYVIDSQVSYTVADGSTMVETDVLPYQATNVEFTECTAMELAPGTTYTMTVQYGIFEYMNSALGQLVNHSTIEALLYWWEAPDGSGLPRHDGVAWWSSSADAELAGIKVCYGEADTCVPVVDNWCIGTSAEAVGDLEITYVFYNDSNGGVVFGQGAWGVQTSKGISGPSCQYDAPTAPPASE